MASPRRVLLVTALWPPAAYIGTRRPVRLAHYLPAHGWTPVVLHDDPVAFGMPGARSIDRSLTAPDCEVHTAQGLMPAAKAMRGLMDAAERVGGPRARHVVNRLTAGWVLPDHYPQWAPAAVRAAARIPDIDAVWTTGRPFGIFVAALAVARRLGVPCVLDYRDPWSIDIKPDRVPRWPKAAHTALERHLLARAQGVSYVNDDMLARNRAAFGQPAGAHWAAIPNGYDAAEYADLTPLAGPRPTVRYTGGFYGQRSVVPALKALAAAPELALDLEIYGELDVAGRQALKANPMADRVRVSGRVGVHEIRRRQLGASALLLAVGPEHRTALTGKIFDYVCAGRPIIGYGPPDAAAGDLIRAAGLGVWIDAADTDGLRAAFAQAAAGTLPYAPRADVLHPYSAQQMAARTADLLSAVCP